MTDQELDTSVAAMLRFGVTLAACIVFVGSVLLLRHGSDAMPNYQAFHLGDSGLRTLKGIVQGAIHLSPTSVIQLGLLVLIATPVARVVLCLVGFARQKSAVYVGVSGLVLLVLLFSLLRRTL